jgi:hypothetical protein
MAAAKALIWTGIYSKPQPGVPPLFYKRHKLVHVTGYFTFKVGVKEFAALAQVLNEIEGKDHAVGHRRLNPD